MTADRLAEIEEHYQHCWVTEVPHAFEPGSGHLDDVEWLIVQVKQLRAALEQIATTPSYQGHMLGNATYSFYDGHATFARDTLDMSKAAPKLDAEASELL